MKRLAVIIAIASGFALLLGAGAVWNEYLRAPPMEALPLPTNLIALDTPAGQKLLAESAAADLDDLQASFVPQSRKAYCSVASALTTLNAADAANAANATSTPLDERALFAHPSVTPHPLKVSFIGMSLRELGDVLRAHGAEVTVVQASSTNADKFRQTARSNLGREGDFLLVNYEREHIGQEQSGHISPVAAYHAQSDRLLILDVAAHKYPPVWVRLDDIWGAMRAPLNSETSVTRGYLVVHRDAVAQGATASLAQHR